MNVSDANGIFGDLETADSVVVKVCDVECCYRFSPKYVAGFDAVKFEQRC